MRNKVFFGRNREIKLIESLFKKNTASLVVCRGRRRIGKSALIQEFGKKADNFLEFQGLAPEAGIGPKEQLESFSKQLSEQTELPVFQLGDWSQAFALLAKSIPAKKTLILLDEISWMAKGDKTFSAVLKIAWDTLFKKHSKLIVVLCGSVSSWIDKNILKNTGYVGRASLDIVLEELPLHQCNGFFGKRPSFISTKEKLKILSVTGGVPRYLEEINPRQSAEENIKRMAFQKEGILFNDFNRIFNDVFGRRAAIYKRIVTALAEGGKTYDGMCDFLNQPKGGSFVKYLNDLELSGYLARDVSFHLNTGKPSKSAIYRLKDNYTRFYLKHIEPVAESVRQGIFDNVPLENIIRWDVISGLQFENLVLSNRMAVCRILNIEMAGVKSVSPYFQNRTARQSACQIDLLIQTKHTLYPCEIKFRDQIPYSIIDEMKDKISRLKIPAGLSVRPVLIYCGVLAEKVHREDYFNNIINIEEMFT